MRAGRTLQTRADDGRCCSGSWRDQAREEGPRSQQGRRRAAAGPPPPGRSSSCISTARPHRKRGPSRQSRGVSTRGHAATRLDTQVAPTLRGCRELREGRWAHPGRRRPSIFGPQRESADLHRNLPTRSQTGNNPRGHQQWADGPPRHQPAERCPSRQDRPSADSPGAPTRPAPQAGLCLCTGARALEHKLSPVWCPAFRHARASAPPYLGPPPEAQSSEPIPKGCCLQGEGLSGHKPRPGPCFHGPPSPSPPMNRGWAPAPLPAGCL